MVSVGNATPAPRLPIANRTLRPCFTLTAHSPRDIDRKSTRLNSSHMSISYAVFCLNDTATPEIYTLSLHDALPIYATPAPRLPIANRTLRPCFTLTAHSPRD